MDYGRYYESFYKIEKLKPPVTKILFLKLLYRACMRDLLKLLTSAIWIARSVIRKSNKTNRFTACKRWPVIQNNEDVHETGLNDWKDIIRKIHLLRCNNLFFIGGEPLLKKEMLLELFRYSKSIGVANISLFTNGMLLDDEEVQRTIIRCGVLN